MTTETLNTRGFRMVILEIESLKAGTRYLSIKKLKAVLKDPRTGRIVLGAMLNLGRRQGGWTRWQKTAWEGGKNLAPRGSRGYRGIGMRNGRDDLGLLISIDLRNRTFHPYHSIFSISLLCPSPHNWNISNQKTFLNFNAKNCCYKHYIFSPWKVIENIIKLCRLVGRKVRFDTGRVR